MSQPFALQTCRRVFLGLMNSGRPVANSVTTFLNDPHPFYCGDSAGENGVPDESDLRPLGLGDIAITGDPYTKIHGVYTGTNDLNNNWYK